MLKFYHAPWSRSSGIFWLLGELGVDFELINIDIRQDGGVPEEYRLIQPNKKVPAIVHDGVAISERAAIAIYLADAFPEARLAPAIGDPERGPYISMQVYISGVLDPCITMKAKGFDYESNDHGFGTFDDMVVYLERILTERPYAAGQRFTAADVMLASSIEFVMNGIHILPERPAFKDYLARVGQRPAMLRSAQRDMEMAKDVPAFRHMFDQAT